MSIIYKTISIIISRTFDCHYYILTDNHKTLCLLTPSIRFGLKHLFGSGRIDLLRFNINTVNSQFIINNNIFYLNILQSNVIGTVKQ